jgi:DNA polymerase-4
MDAYSAASKAVFAIFRETTPMVEPLSVDEAFLDINGRRRSGVTPIEVATQLRDSVRTRVGLPITVGVARTKFLAKVASAVAKPDGLLVVPADGELAFLHPLPIRRLWGVGQVTEQKLRSHGIDTVEQLAALDVPTLTSLVGPAAGRALHALAFCRDPRPVTLGRRRRSIGSQSALGQRPRTFTELEARLLGLVERVCRRLRSADRVCRTVVLRLRFADFSRATRSYTMAASTADTQPILLALRRLLRNVRPLIESRGLSLIGISLANLDGEESLQPELPFLRADTAALDAAVDLVRDRFGSAVVTRGVLVGSDPGLSVPLLPD